MARSFACTFDYRCPFARNVHEALVNGLREGRDWDIEFKAFSLDQVHVADSVLLAADRDMVTALAASGERLRGFAPVVVRASTVEEPAEDRVTLQVVDRWPPYEVVAAEDEEGPALRAVEGRGEAEVRMVLRATDGGWRIEHAERTA